MAARCCCWLERGADGRPRCEHGWAIKAGPRWRCPSKHRVNCRKWDRTESGRDHKRRRNATEAMRSSKRLYELTRIR